LAHKVIRPTRQGYGKILGQCIWVSKRMYCRLLTMQDRDPNPSPRFKIVPFQMLPAERAGLGPDAIERERAMVARFVPLNNGELLAHLTSHPEEEKLFNELGSDQVILAYAFNFLEPTTGDWNQDPDKLNALNNKIFEICSITAESEDPNSIKLILTSSQFDAEVYGSDFVEHYARRLGLKKPDAKTISFLISTTMNPWTTDTPPTPDRPAGGDFLEVVEEALREAVYQAINELGVGPPVPTDTSALHAQGQHDAGAKMNG